MLPALLVRATWADRLRGKNIIHVTDNTSVKKVRSHFGSSYHCIRRAYQVKDPEAVTWLRWA
eukprot:2550296-Amphidinium_carterae.1